MLALAKTLESHSYNEEAYRSNSDMGRRKFCLSYGCINNEADSPEGVFYTYNLCSGIPKLGTTSPFDEIKKL
jgi:hypothetical protein